MVDLNISSYSEENDWAWHWTWHCPLRSEWLGNAAFVKSTLPHKVFIHTLALLHSEFERYQMSPYSYVVARMPSAMLTSEAWLLSLGDGDSQCPRNVAWVKISTWSRLYSKEDNDYSILSQVLNNWHKLVFALLIIGWDTCKWHTVAYIID